jgi:hypothetical protein
MKSIRTFITEKLNVNLRSLQPTLFDLTIDEIAQQISHLFENDDFSNGHGGGHCTGFEAIRNCGLYDTITYHCMEEDIVGVLLDDFTPNNVDEFLEFADKHGQDLTKAILEYE